MPLDFKRATDLFMGREEELVRALRIDAATLQAHRARPAGTPLPLLRDLADVLDERGRAMIRVAEMLLEQVKDADGQNNGRGRG